MAGNSAYFQTSKTKKANWRGWVEFSGEKKVYLKSLFEYRFACYLEYLKDNQVITDWQYEPQTFKFDGISRGITNYKPDFKAIHPTSEHEWFEVKGYVDRPTLTKLDRMKRYHPKEKITLIDKPWMVANKKLLEQLAPQTYIKNRKDE